MDALITAEELPGDWSRYDPEEDASGGPGVCGIETPTAPERIAEAATGWARDPVEGPILGERIEAYAESGAAERLERSRDLPLPCEWDEFGMRWRATAEPPIDLGDDSWVYLIEGLTGRGSYNYEVVLRRGDALVLFVLNTHDRDRGLLEDLVQRGWEKADAELASG